MNYKFETNRIYAENESGIVIAEITFPETEKGVFTINHTFVDSSLRGKGVAGELVKLAASQIGEQGGKVQATCSYAKKWLEKNS
ncbi:MAG: N-acetyltransferase [Clostridiales bacterium]|nr:N-acetyltransferase [Clostridiales bacterium]